jgi:hypothetical protein
MPDVETPLTNQQPVEEKPCLTRPVNPLDAELARLQAENAALKAKKSGKPESQKAVDPDRSAACKRAWDTIRANRAAAQNCPRS